MSSLADQLISELIRDREGGYVNHKDDLGGETIHGITVQTARRHGYTADMRLMPVGEAKRIYLQEYWYSCGLDKVAAVYPKVAEELFDTGVNMGTSVAGRFLQQALNMFHDAELVEDGKIGPATISALKSFQARRGALGSEVLVKAVDCFQGARYCDLVKSRERNRSFVFGWFAHRIGNVKG